jgi:hypothetical protein
MDLNMPYRIKTIDRNFVGYLTSETERTAMFRIGTEDKLIVTKKEIQKADRLSPRDIETRKNGRFFTF